MQNGVGMWWRFSEYEVEDGYVRPAVGATLSTFDLWRRYENPESETWELPYQQLVALVQDLPSDKRLFSQITDEQMKNLQGKATSWCKKYGLFGILPNNLLSAQIGNFAVARTGAKFIEVPTQSAGEIDEPEIGDFTITDDSEGEYLLEYSDSTWWNYFPGISGEDRKERSDLLPLSDAFWQEYAEPFDAFILTAKRFANAVEVLSLDRETVEEHVAGPITSTLDREGALKRLNNLASRVCEAASSTELEGRVHYQERWESPSLIGHLAMQTLKFELFGRRYAICPRCGEKFPMTTGHIKKYCSDRCRSSAAKERKRRRS